MNGIKKNQMGEDLVIEVASVQVHLCQSNDWGKFNLLYDDDDNNNMLRLMLKQTNTKFQ